MNGLQLNFDKKNSNAIIVKKDGKIINYICCPPCKSGCDVISFNLPPSKGYTYNFGGLIIITSQIKFLWICKTIRRMYHKGKLIDYIIF